jgi:hypothetical protein
MSIPWCTSSKARWASRPARIIHGCKVGISKLLDPSDQVGLPLLVPLFDQAAGLVGSNGRYRVRDATAHCRHQADEQRHEERWWRGPVLAAQRHEPAVLPASDLTHFEGFGEQPEFGEKPPKGVVTRIA